jgi:hypothetical protein
MSFAACHDPPRTAGLGGCSSRKATPARMPGDCSDRRPVLDRRPRTTSRAILAPSTRSACEGATRRGIVLSSAAYVRVGIGLANNLVSDAQPPERVAEAPEAASSGLSPVADHWLVWLLALAAIAIPVVILFIAASIPKDAAIWSQVTIAAKRGDFLVPVLILSMDTMRRWCRELKCKAFLGFVKLIACVFCVLAAFICLIATSEAASLAITPEAGTAIEQITVMCMVIPVSFGTLAVGLSAKPDKSND